MENEELKKGSAVTKFDKLTDEDLEAVLGGIDWDMNPLLQAYVRAGETYSTTIMAKPPTFDQSLKDVLSVCGNSTVSVQTLDGRGTGFVADPFGATVVP